MTARAFICSSLLIFSLNPSLPAKTVDTCFSPLGHCDQVLVSWIDSAQKSLDGAIYGLTDPSIAAAFIRAKHRGVQIRLIQDRSQSKDRKAVFQHLQQAGIPVRVQRGTGGGIQHNKFLIMDGTYVITGSFNWTVSASRRNDENFVILDDQAPKFAMEFERLWSSAERPRRRQSKSRSNW
jgi:phosphatidylserine/phosphatidylglycerophosphate/cardiolipin synthase-like enzyme